MDPRDPPAFRPVRSISRWKVGLDLGSSTTVMREARVPAAGPARTSGHVLPTLLAFPDPAGDGRPEIGEAAERLRDRRDVACPLALDRPRRGAALRAFFEGLRERLGASTGDRPWGVIARPTGTDRASEEELRLMAGDLFERILLVDAPLLIAMGILQDPVGRHAMIVDIGRASVRAYLVGGCAPGAGDTVEVPGGGIAVDRELGRLLHARYPDLRLTGLTLARMKEKIGFVAPARRPARLRVVLGGSSRLLEVGITAAAAGEAVVPGVLKAIREIIGRCPSDHVDAFLSSIFLCGGGAAMPGLPERIQAELEAEGLDAAAVHSVKDPGGIGALGALKWALQTPDDAWEIPLFSYRAAM